MEKELTEFVNNLRLQAKEFEEYAINNSVGENFTIKFCSMMYAYREIADEIENKFLKCGN